MRSFSFHIPCQPTQSCKKIKALYIKSCIFASEDEKNWHYWKWQLGNGFN